MLAAKSFEPSSDMAALERWVTILAEELAERMAADNKLFNRRPKSLHLHYRSVTHNPHAVLSVIEGPGVWCLGFTTHVGEHTGASLMTCLHLLSGRPLTTHMQLSTPSAMLCYVLWEDLQDCLILPQ